MPDILSHTTEDSAQGSVMKLLIALNAAAASLQRSAHSEQEVLDAFQEQLTKLNLHGGISLLDQSGKCFTLHAVAEGGPMQLALERLENNSGKKSDEYPFELSQVDLYRQVIKTGEALYVDDAAQLFPQIFAAVPESVLPGSQAPSKAPPGVFAPLKREGKIIGILNLVGPELTREDAPAIQAFANHMSIALTNAKLFSRLSETELRFQSLVESSHEGFVIVDDNFHIVYANPEFNRLTGYQPDELQGLDFRTLLTDESRDLVADRYQRRLRGEEAPSRYEVKVVRKGGQLRQVEVIATLVKDERLPVRVMAQILDVTELKRSEEAIQRQLEELRVLHAIASSGAQATSVDELIAGATAIVGQSLYPDHFGILLLDDSGNTLRVHPSYQGLPEHFYKMQIPISQGISGRVVTTGKAMRVADVSQIPEYLLSTPGIRSELCVPLKVGERVLGVINAESAKEGNFSEADERLLTTIAGQLAIAIEKVRLFEGSQRQAQELASLYRASLATSRELLPEKLLQLMNQQVQDLIQPDAFLVAFYDERTNEVEIPLAVEEGREEPGTTGLRFSLDDGGLTGWVIQERQPLLVTNMETDPLPVSPKHAGGRMPVSWLGVPLIIGERVIGAVSVQSFSENAFDHSHQQFLESLAAQCAIAIENARLFNEANTRGEKMAHLTILGHKLNRTHTISQVLNRIGEGIQALAETDRVAIYVRTSQESARCAWSRNISNAYLEQVIANIQKVPGGQLLSSTDPVLIPEVGALPQEAPIRILAEKEGFRAIALWPLVYEGKVIAAVGCYYLERHPWTGIDHEIMETFTRQAATALQNAHLFVAESERRREAEILRKVTSALTQTLETDEVLDAILGQLADVIQYDSASVMLLRNSHLELVVHRGLQAPDRLPARVERLPHIQEVLGQKRPVVIPDTHADERWVRLPQRQDIRCWMGIPLLVKDRVIGLLSLDKKEVGFYAGEDTQLALAFANQAAVALDNARLYEQTERRLERLDALRTIDITLASGLDLRGNLKIILEQVIAQLELDAAAVMLLNTASQELEFAVQIGFHTGVLRPQRQSLISSTAGHAALEREMISIPDLNEVAHESKDLQGYAQDGFVAYYAIPLIAKGRVNGVLELFNRSRLQPDGEWLNFMETLAGQIAIAIDSATMFENLQRSNTELRMSYEITLEGWSRALELRDHETEGHSDRVSEMTIELARMLGMREHDLVHVRRGALLHDIGKIGIPDSILFKQGSLTEEEMELMHQHPVFAYNLLYPIPHLRPALDIPYCHHERWDGTGYPRGLKGEAIPLAARIFKVVDVWDALRNDRPYRQAWSDKKALAYIREQTGKQFDPQVVETFLKMLGM